MKPEEVGLPPWEEWDIIDHGPIPSLQEANELTGHWPIRVAASGVPEVHCWTGPRGVVFGRTDHRRPGFAAATAALEAAGVQWVSRLSGGTMVPQGPEVSDVVVLLPRGRESIDIVTDYLAGLRPLLEALRSLGLPAGHAAIPGTFCAGPYDIAVGGRKVAGTAQARRLDHSEVGAVILREGTPEDLLRDEQLTRPHLGVPQSVRWGRIATLSELLGHPLSHRELVTAIQGVLRP